MMKSWELGNGRSSRTDSAADPSAADRVHCFATSGKPSADFRRAEIQKIVFVVALFTTGKHQIVIFLRTLAWAPRCSLLAHRLTS